MDIHIAMARDFLNRAERRINGAATAAARPDADSGEFDNNVDGISKVEAPTGRA